MTAWMVNTIIPCIHKIVVKAKVIREIPYNPPPLLFPSMCDSEQSINPDGMIPSKGLLEVMSNATLFLSLASRQRVLV